MACWIAGSLTHEFVAGALSVADFAILGWAWRHPRHKVELADFPNVERWYDALMARPASSAAWKRSWIELLCRPALLPSWPGLTGRSSTP